MLYFILLVVILSIMIVYITITKSHVKTSSFAAVMAFGIFIEGVILQQPDSHFNHSTMIKVLAFSVISLWITLFVFLIQSGINRRFTELHLNNPINRFGIGTWVAGTSICGILTSHLFPELRTVSELIAYINHVLWLSYVLLCLKTFIELMKTKLYKKAHGILLLTTVSTQSIVLLNNTVFTEVPYIYNVILVSIGFCFYIIGAFFIFMRYVLHPWSIEGDWNNTNCILHGALSITGIACLNSGINEQITVTIWILAFLMFLLIESIEILRLIKRIHSLGLKKGLCVYDVTQWSRIFTFSMFYTFTSKLQVDLFIFNFVSDAINVSGLVIILFLLCIEFVLSFHYVLTTYRKNLHFYSTDHEVMS